MSPLRSPHGRRTVGARLVGHWCRLAVVAAVAAVGIEGARAADDLPRVPRSLGLGTGGDGAWSCASAAHSPAAVRVDATAGPAATPAAVLDFEFTAVAYNWNWATVAVGGAGPDRFEAVRVTYRTDMPAGFPALSVMVRATTGGGSYWAPQSLPPSPARFRTVTVPLSRFSVPAWSSDPDGKLDAERLANVSIGLEGGQSGKGRVVLADVELVPAGW